jgi:signal peptidase II
MKGRTIILIIFLVVFFDQALKIYIKTHYSLEEYHFVFGKWFRLFFIENEGMAYGWKLGGNGGKMILTLFRLCAVIFGVWYIRDMIRKKSHPGLLLCASLIFAGALGNLIDSMFYGLIFENSGIYYVASLFPKGGGYAGFLHGNVVDMLYFPVIRDAHIPFWVPIIGGNDFEFFRPIFNIADASISIGVISLLVFQKKFFRQQKNEMAPPVMDMNISMND